jgi:AcrR family transcriptional regulator
MRANDHAAGDAPSRPESHAREDTRARLLAAAARVYAQHGYHGATTRLIALEAGVNEVTLFRIFGSKDALLDEGIHQSSVGEPRTPLASVPADPLGELTAWCGAELARLGRVRELLQQCFADAGGHPRRSRRAGELIEESALELRRYTAQLAELGLIRGGGNQEAAIAMLLSTLLADAVGREELPGIFPAVGEDVPTRYAATFLAALGYANRSDSIG